MAAQKGRSTLLYADLAGGSPQVFTLLPGLRDTDWTVNGDQVDVTSKDSNTWRTLLAGAGIRSLDVSVSGIFQDADLEDDEIGGLPEAWNWLEGHSDPSIQPKLVHFTRGTPDFPGYADAAYADEWHAYANPSPVALAQGEASACGDRDSGPMDLFQPKEG